MLVVGNLPSGWSVSHPGTAPSITQPKCFIDAERTAQAKAYKLVSFVRGQFPSLTEQLGYYPAASAVANYTASTAALDSCKHVAFGVTYDGYHGTLSGTVNSIAAPGLGDQSRAYAVYLSGNVLIQIAIVRKGHELLVVVYANQGNSAPAPGQALTRTAYSRLTAS
jgi:hypothetical protein